MSPGGLSLRVVTGGKVEPVTMTSPTTIGGEVEVTEFARAYGLRVALQSGGIDSVESLHDGQPSLRVREVTPMLRSPDIASGLSGHLTIEASGVRADELHLTDLTRSASSGVKVHTVSPLPASRATTLRIEPAVA